ncbi:hypothetical protein [Chitinophaga jiangningensis]|uniref:hypothetical protein n=1 Tax=Chitinophaga jiangningensis TaxID=1419482 RepID=UPI0011603CC3|nr:hypothetical protein [Chitinophaga jiangningensis]
MLGLISDEESAELAMMCQKYPELQTEIDMVERRFERLAFDEIIHPPMELKDRVLENINRSREKEPEPLPNYTFINIQPKQASTISVHVAWRLIFILLVIIAQVAIFLAIFYYLKYSQLQKNTDGKIVHHIAQAY